MGNLGRLGDIYAVVGRPSNLVNCQISLQNNELVLGTMHGEVYIFKGKGKKPWAKASDLGTVSSATCLCYLFCETNENTDLFTRMFCYNYIMTIFKLICNVILIQYVTAEYGTLDT
jgi:hypothetical protein